MMNHITKIPTFKKMIRFNPWEILHGPYAFLFGIFIGLLAWGHEVNYTPLSLFILFGYLLLDQKKNLWLLVLGYYLASSRGLLIGISNYYDSFIFGVSLWLIAGLINSFPWIVIWNEDKLKRIWLLPLLLIILILPPFGFISWVNPIITAGYYFPAYGGFGFLLLFSLMGFLIFLQRYFSSIIPIVLIGSVSLGTSYQTTFSNVEAIESNFYYGPGEADSKKENKRLKYYLAMANQSDKNIIVLPENALGYVDENSKLVYSHLNTEKKLLGGANLRDPQNFNMYDNILLEVSKNGIKTLYKQRVPVPIAMWKPFSNTGAKAYINGDSIIHYIGQKIGIFICYEQLLTFTYFQTMYHNPDLLIGISNLWWARNTSIENIQKVNLELWSRLYNIPFIFSVNH